MTDGLGGGGKDGAWSSRINPSQVQTLVSHLLTIGSSPKNDDNIRVASIGFLKSERKYRSKPMTQRQSCVLPFLGGPERVSGRTMEAARLVKASSSH